MKPRPSPRPAGVPPPPVAQLGATSTWGSGKETAARWYFTATQARGGWGSPAAFAGWLYTSPEALQRVQNALWHSPQAWLLSPDALPNVVSDPTGESREYFWLDGTARGGVRVAGAWFYGTPARARELKSGLTMQPDVAWRIFQHFEGRWL